jgi:hypothetical protein
MALQIGSGALESPHHMIVPVTAVLRVGVGDDDNSSCWILLSTHHIGLNRHPIKGF